MPRKISNRDAPAGALIGEHRPGSPLIFLSHDSRDAELAEAFDHLLGDASGGVLRSFRSSDRKGFAGIEFGAEWYSMIMAKLSEATAVVALLTPNSLGRPWILYEVGVAQGTLRSSAFGVAFGIQLDQISGPFAQFQNSADDEDSLTKLVLQLILRNPSASPREEAVRRQVTAFRQLLPQILKGHKQPASPERLPDAATIAKLFEEVKVMFREVSDRLDRQLSSEGGSGSFASDSAEFRYVYSDLMTTVELALRRLVTRTIREMFPSIEAAVEAHAIPPIAAVKGLDKLTFGETRDFMRHLLRSGHPLAKRLPNDQELDRLTSVVHVRNKLVHRERVTAEEMARALAELMRFVNENAALIFVTPTEAT